MTHPQDQGRCLLDGYFECATKIPEACICHQMPKDMALQLSKEKYDNQEAQSKAEHYELLRHNAEFDRWESMTDSERDREIRAALRRS
jgi:hypothetical protein